jgi:hypothetical protein
MWNAFLQRRKRVDMMSTALVMAVGIEQTKMGSATSGRVESGEMTFAQSFGERAGLSTDVQTMNSTGDAPNGMHGGKSSGLVKNSDAPSDASSGAKPNGSVDHRTIGGNETKNVAVTVANGAGKSVVAETSLLPLANASDGGQSKTTPGQQPPADRGVLQQDTAVKVVAQTGMSQTKTTEAAAAIGNEALPAGNVEEAVEASSNASGGLPLGASTKVDSVPGESTALPDRSLLSRDEVQSSVQNGNALAGKTLEVASAKKGAKVQESAVGAKAASKTTEMSESAKTVGDASIVAAVPGAIPLPTQVVAQSAVQPNAIGVSAANVSGVVGTIQGKFVSEGATASADSTSRKATARAGKDEVETTRQGANPAAGVAASPGFGAEIDKAAAVRSAAGKDADSKGLSAVGAGALVHSETGNEAVVSGVVPGMASGHTLAEVSGTKTQAAEGGAHAATVQAGLGEQDGSGSVATEVGMSHRTLLATPRALEVGVSNGTQGWLKIRAEMTDGGVVNASLSSASSAGQEMLHRELPALTAYLQEERVSVNTVVAPANAAAGTDSRFAGSMDGNGSGQARQSSHQGGGDERQGSIRGTADHADQVPMYVGLNGVGEDGVLSAGTYAGGGSWLNVRA